MTTEEFIKKAKEVHGNKYDYSKVEYKNRDEKVCIICPEHGEFWQTPHNHLRGSKCPKCSNVYKPTKAEWIEKAKMVHGDKYDYSKVDYKRNKEKVCIICPEHGEFWQSPNNHLKGEGCPMCKYEKFSKERKNDVSVFITKSREKYGDKYDYSKVEYINNHTKVCIVCPKHGNFYKTPINFLFGQECPFCKKNKIDKVNVNVNELNKKETNRDFGEIYLERFHKIYGGKYDYSKFKYITSSTKSCIICPEHGEFYKSPNKHIKQGCPICTKENIKNRIKDKKDEYIRKAEKIHNNKYDYSEIDFKGAQYKIKIICPEHGEFWQNAASHLRGCGCPKCAQKNRNLKQTKSTNDFIVKAKEKFPEYDYSETVYVNNTTPIKIICHNKYKNGIEHGTFTVSPNKFITRGTSCPHCSNFSSKPELEIYDFVKTLIPENEIILHDRTILGNKHEIDIYVPLFNVAIEFNGIFWHSDNISHINKNSHIEKTKICEEKGIHLIQIFSDEYFYHKEIVLSKIKHLLKKDSDLPKIYARKCIVKEITYETSKEFLDINHIQGCVNASIYLGCYYVDELIGVMTFIKENKESNKWELNRFATNINYHCVGVGGKLFSYFVNNYNPKEIKSFADRRWVFHEKNIYKKIGFNEVKIIPPDYRYLFKNKPSLGRMHKFNFRKQILHKKYGLPLSMTENEMTKQLGYYKIYDCGLIKYVWKKNN